MSFSRSFLSRVCAFALFASVVPSLHAAPLPPVPGGSWVQQMVTGPTARTGAVMAYDAVRQNVVMFGGTNGGTMLQDTWTWDGAAWTQKSPATSPSARTGAVAAYNPATGGVLLFGGVGSGGLLDDTWLWNGSTWTLQPQQQPPPFSPAARSNGMMAQDASGNVVLFGGNGTGGALNDTWIWSGTTWTAPSLAMAPSARASSVMVFNDTTGKIVLFGGGTTNTARNDTWEFDGAWTQKSPATVPAGRKQAVAAYDAATGTVIMYGGALINTSYLNDTYAWDGTNWTLQTPAANAGNRYASQAAYNGKTGRVVLFGGSGFQGQNADTYTFAATNFLAPQTAVGATAVATPVYFYNVGSSTLGTPQVVTQGAPNLDFTIGQGSTCSGAQTADTTCVVNVVFNPRYPGQRLGAVNLTNGGGTVVATAFVSGVGTGPEIVYTPGTITTIVGTGVSCPNPTAATGACGDGGAAANATVSFPSEATADAAGNVYIADRTGNRIRKISPAGVVTTIAGNGSSNYTGDGGAATSAELSGAFGTAVDGAGNVYTTLGDYYRVRKVTAATGIITTVVGNGGSTYTSAMDGTAATGASLNAYHVSLDGLNRLYVSDFDGRVLRVSNGQIRSIAGGGGSLGDGGPAVNAQMTRAVSTTVDSAGNVFIADSNGNRVRKITAATGRISTVYGDGTPSYSSNGSVAATSSVNAPYQVAVDPAGNLYVAAFGESLIRKIDAAGILSTVAGTGAQGYVASQDGGPATSANNYALRVTLDGSGNLLIADYGNKRVRMVSNKSGATFPTATTPGTVDTTDGTKTFQLNNMGNAVLTLTSQAVSSSNFQLMNPMSGGCSPTGTVNPGAGCTVGVQFNPGAGASGVISGSVNTTSNAVVATAAPLLVGSTSNALALQVSSNVSVVQGNSINLNFVIGYPGAQPSGTRTFTVNGSATGVGTPTCTLKNQHMNCVYPYNSSSLTQGTYTITGAITAGGGYAAGSTTGTLTVK